MNGNAEILELHGQVPSLDPHVTIRTFEVGGNHEDSEQLLVVTKIFVHCCQGQVRLRCMRGWGERLRFIKKQVTTKPVVQKFTTFIAVNQQVDSVRWLNDRVYSG